MKILRESGYVPIPWKNLGGVTREILRVPPEPTAFDWRLSLANIDAPGPFSSFPGYERTLILIRGAGVSLDFGGHGSARLTTVGAHAEFDGGWETACTLVDGSCTDLNLMVSRERVESLRRALVLKSNIAIETAEWDETIVCCISGSVEVTNRSGDGAELHAVDVARCTPADGTVRCEPRGGSPRMFIAQVRAAGPAPFPGRSIQPAS